MRKLKPQAYLDEFYPNSGMCQRTVINWIKAGHIKGEQTKTRRWLVLIEDQPESKVNSLVKMMEAAAA